MQEYILRLCKELERQQLWDKESRLLLAVSGGADSMALLGLVQQLPPEWQPQFAVVHVHHHLREESDEEFRMVQDYCQSQRIPFFAEHWSEESHPKSNLEMAAREFRYAFFADMMEKWPATHLATAHHADDQLETILMRLVRGSTLKGISGIAMTRTFGPGQLVRPLLVVPERRALSDLRNGRDSLSGRQNQFGAEFHAEQIPQQHHSVAEGGKQPSIQAFRRFFGRSAGCIDCRSTSCSPVVSFVVHQG